MVALKTPAALALAGVLAVTLVSPALAEPTVLKPSGNWHVDYGDDVCRLGREFSDGKNTHYFTLKQYWPAASAGMTVAGPGFRRFVSREKTTLRFAADNPGFEGRPFTGTVEGYGPALVFSAINLAKGEPVPNQPDADDSESGRGALDLREAAKVRFVEFKQGVRIVRLETGPLADAFKVMNDCTASLVKEWGLDPERLRTAQSGPRWINQAALVRKIAAAYPGGALLRGEQGIMRMRVIVDAQGAVEQCTIIKATETERLESPACEVMKSAEFEPARDAAGQPMRSYYATSITYQISR